MWHRIVLHTHWITAGAIGLFIAIFPMLKNALYRYVLRKLDETRDALEVERQGLTLYHNIYGDDGIMPEAGEQATASEVLQKCRLLWGRFPTPAWLARLALQWEEHKKKARI
jgi:hypothetical protein